MFLATRVRKDFVFNAYFTWEKKERVIRKVLTVEVFRLNVGPSVYCFITNLQ